MGRIIDTFGWFIGFFGVGFFWMSFLIDPIFFLLSGIIGLGVTIEILMLGGDKR